MELLRTLSLSLWLSHTSQKYLVHDHSVRWTGRVEAVKQSAPSRRKGRLFLKQFWFIFIRVFLWHSIDPISILALKSIFNTFTSMSAETAVGQHREKTNSWLSKLDVKWCVGPTRVKAKHKAKELYSLNHTSTAQNKGQKW